MNHGPVSVTDANLLEWLLPKLFNQVLKPLCTRFLVVSHKLQLKALQTPLDLIFVRILEGVVLKVIDAEVLGLRMVRMIRSKASDVTDKLLRVTLHYLKVLPLEVGYRHYLVLA